MIHIKDIIYWCMICHIIIYMYDMYKYWYCAYGIIYMQDILSYHIIMYVTFFKPGLSLFPRVSSFANALPNMFSWVVERGGDIICLLGTLFCTLTLFFWTVGNPENADTETNNIIPRKSVRLVVEETIVHELQGVNERIKRQEERGGDMFFVLSCLFLCRGWRRTTQDGRWRNPSRHRMHRHVEDILQISPPLTSSWPCSPYPSTQPLQP